MICIGLDFKRADLQVRAKASKISNEFFETMTDCLAERVLLSTCNRVEIYGILKNHDPSSIKSSEVLQQLIRSWATHSEIEDISVFQIWVAEEAVEHLFKVAASLESMVIGETEINSQVKSSYDFWSLRKTVGPFLHHAFQKAFKVSKRVRNETEIGRFAVSIPSVAVKLCEKLRGPIPQWQVGIIGLGQIGRVAAEHFASAHPKKLRLMNRTTATAESIRNQLQSDFVEVCTDALEVVSASDVLVIAADGFEWTQQMTDVWIEQDSRVLIDLCVPPRVSPLNDFHFVVDDLREMSESNRDLRAQELQRAQEIVRDEAQKVIQRFKAIYTNRTSQDVTVKVDVEAILAAENSKVSSTGWLRSLRHFFRLS